MMKFKTFLIEHTIKAIATVHSYVVDIGKTSNCNKESSRY